MTANNEPKKVHISSQNGERQKVRILSKDERKKVLVLTGSPVSQYYYQVSFNYAVQFFKGTKNNCITKEFEFTYVTITSYRTWIISQELNEMLIRESKSLPQHEAISIISKMSFDACINIMYCWPGITTYRSLMDLLGIPLVGPSSSCMALVTNKAQAKAVVEAVGVCVPKGEILWSQDQIPTIPYPFVVKPCREDNSMGVSRVNNASELPGALANAFKYDSSVLCEEYIPLGREIRVGVFEDENGEPTHVLPATEYLVTPEHPMRTSADKIKTENDVPVKGDDFLSSKCSDAPAHSRSVTPAVLDDELAEKIGETVRLAHKALGCRDYSIYDLRVDPKGKVFMLECQPNCSFAPNHSVLMVMAQKSEKKELQHPMLCRSILRRTAARKQKAQTHKVLGMLN